MKTRSGIVPLPRGWPSIYEVRKGMATIQTGDQLLNTLRRLIAVDDSEPDIYKRRLTYLTAAEMILKYHFTLGDEAAQKFINSVIQKLGKIPGFEEYVKQFKVLSDKHRTAAKQTYVEFFFKGLTNVDCAKQVASFVTV